MNLSSVTTTTLPYQPSTLHSKVDNPDKQVAQQPQTVSTPASVEEKRQSALQIVNNTLTKAYEKISSRGQSSTADYSAFEPLTAEKVAGNILGFIERRLKADVADGATQEQLQSRLEAGLSGFQKGFAEAKEKLEALSLLSPDIANDIGKTKDLVLKGIDELRAKFIDSTQTPPTTTAPANSTDKKLAVPDFVPKTKQATNNSNYEYARAREFSFQLKTKEGDTVTISASASEGFAYEKSSDGKNISGSYSASQSMQWQVDGNLNDDEVSAINDLLGHVNDLANQFFDGDLDTAFEQAKSLGYDDAQIGSFSLHIAQADIQQVTQAYKTFEPTTANTDEQTPQLSDQLLPIGNFIKDLLESLTIASIFPDPEKLLGDIAKNITANNDDKNQGERLQNFLNRMTDVTADSSIPSQTDVKNS